MEPDVIVLTSAEVKRIKQEAWDKMARYAKHIASLYEQGHGSTWYSTPEYNAVATKTAKDIAFDLSCYEGEDWT